MVSRPARHKDGGQALDPILIGNPAASGRGIKNHNKWYIFFLLAYEQEHIFCNVFKEIERLDFSILQEKKWDALKH